MKKFFLVCLVLLFLAALAANLFAQSPAGSLPVVLVDVNAALTTNKQVAISWTTQQQIEMDCFNVEKSGDGVSWQCIAVVKASGNSAIPVTYNTLDMFPVKGSNFYRIMLKSLNGDFGYTVIKNVRMTQLGKMTLYPNPASNLVNISLEQIPGEDWKISLFNNAGQLLLQKKYNKNTIVVSMPVNSYPNGNYTMEIADGSHRQCKKLMINHN